MEWLTDDYVISPYNLDESAVAHHRFAGDLRIADCTLRDGEQQPGIVFHPHEKVAIARKLDEAGIHEIEAGMPGVSDDDELAVREIVKLRLNATITALARATKADIDKVARCGAAGVVLSLPSGFMQLEHKLHWSEDRVIETALETTAYAKGLGLYVTLSPYDTPRARFDFLKRYLSVCLASGNVDRIRVVDTVGSIGPRPMYHFILKVREIVGDTPIEVHCHNDFGMATATTLLAAEAGANVLSTTVNGLGERAGNTATEEVAVALKVLYGRDIGVDLKQLFNLCKSVEKMSGVRSQPNKAVCGDNAFSHESGLIVEGVLASPFAGESYSPTLVGQTRRILLGKKSGRSSVRMKLTELGIGAGDGQVDEIVGLVKKKSIEVKRNITAEEFQEFCHQVFRGWTREHTIRIGERSKWPIRSLLSSTDS